MVINTGNDITTNIPTGAGYYPAGQLYKNVTDEQESDKYIAATMEVADSTLENRYYSNLTNTRADLPAGYPSDTTTNPNNKVARLNGGSAGPKIGPGITLKVMAGDQFSIRVSSWYKLNGTSPGAPANPLNDLLASLISGIGHLPGGGHPSLSTLQNNTDPLSTNITEFLSDTGSSINSSRPHAFVNWILFDNQFNYVAESSGFDQVGSDTTLRNHVLMNLPVTKSGYLYIYLSNTSNIDVYFDNLQVTHTRGPLAEENHYYPFGLTMAGISDKALMGQYVENKLRYNGKELQDHEFTDGWGLQEYDYGARMQDPQLGRFWSPDRFADKYYTLSTYQYGACNPLRYVDINGDSILTFFYNANGEQINDIPEQVMNSFESEYGIRLGYNADTHMLYGNEITPVELPEGQAIETGHGNASSPLPKSETAINAMMRELGAGHSSASLVFGSNLAVEKNGQVESVGYGKTVDKKTAVIDLADFDHGKLKYADYNGMNQNNPVPTRALNLARIIEHEFLGHAIGKYSDYPNSRFSAGPNEEHVGNPIRSELGLPPRTTYADMGNFGKSSDVSNYNEVRVTDINKLLEVKKTLHY